MLYIIPLAICFLRLAIVVATPVHLPRYSPPDSGGLHGSYNARFGIHAITGSWVISEDAAGETLPAPSSPTPPKPSTTAQGTSNDSSLGGASNPFANPKKTVTATLSVEDRDVVVKGVSAMDVDAYLGIPFAAPRESFSPSLFSPSLSPPHHPLAIISPRQTISTHLCRILTITHPQCLASHSWRCIKARTSNFFS